MVNLPRTDLSSVVNVSPDQYGPEYGANSAYPSWYRQQNGSALGAGILDDQMVIAPRTEYDIYIKRDRVIMLVNGVQRLCNDFPGVSLTMAEELGVLGRCCITRQPSVWSFPWITMTARVSSIYLSQHSLR